MGTDEMEHDTGMGISVAADDVVFRIDAGGSGNPVAAVHETLERLHHHIHTHATEQETQFVIVQSPIVEGGGNAEKRPDSCFAHAEEDNLRSNTPAT